MLKKIIKNNSKIKYKKSFNTELFYDEEFADKKILSDLHGLDFYLQNSKLFFKNSPRDTTTVGLIEINHENFVIKRYNIKNFLHGLKIQFRRSHGLRSFCYSYLLASFGVETLKPVAIIQKKMGIFKLQSYFISRYEEGFPGCVYFNDESNTQNEWHETVNDIVVIINKMQRHCIYHGDFHFGNFVIVNKKPILLDFDHVKIIKNQKRFKKFHAKDLNNFNRYLKRNSKAYEFFQNFLNSCNSIIFK